MYVEQPLLVSTCCYTGAILSAAILQVSLNLFYFSLWRPATTCCWHADHSSSTSTNPSWLH